MELRDIVVVSAVRTPMGDFGGSLRDMPVYELGGHAIREALGRAGVAAGGVDEVLYGNTRQAGNGPNPARTAALLAGVPSSVHATTVNDACPSSMKATILAAQMMCLEEAKVMVVGGMESMSTIPYLLKGARVVVNDLGATDRGEGEDTSVAADVLEEIKAGGGEAVSNPDSVASWDGAHRIVQTALDCFGRIDIVVNNAGIARDRMIFKMSEEEWDAVVEVHLKGTFHCIRAAAPHLREQKSGCFVNFTSTSGLIGNIGQANYGAAKMGIVALSKITAMEMRRYNVTSNCIAPFAWTRLTATIPTETEAQRERVEKLKKMRPADVASLAVFLAGDAAARITGQVFGVRGKEIYLFSLPRIVRSIHKSDGWQVEDLAEMLEATLKSHFAPLDTSPEYISWDPLV